MLLTAQQKLTLMRKAEKNPALAFMDLVKAMEDKMREVVEAKVREMEVTHKAEMAELEKNITEKLVEKIPDYETLLKNVKGLDGDDGEDCKPEEVASVLLADQKFIELTKPKDGEDYILTEEDKKEIAEKIEVPVVEKVIEKTEIIKERPIVTEITKVTNEIREVAKTDPDDVIVEKINKSKKTFGIQKVEGLSEELKVIKRNIKEKAGSKSSGGSGNVVPYSVALSSGTTSITLPDRVASNGRAIWFNYQGQQQSYGTHFTVSGKTITLLFTPSDDTFADLIYIRT